MAIATWILLVSLFFFSASAADSKNNPADELVSVLNKNRTAHKSSALPDNAGLACIAIQYIKAYQGKCDDVGGSNAKVPADAEFVETFAPNCGVQVTTLAPITGRLIACQSHYISPNEAFSELLIHNQRSLDILYSKNHTQVGAAVSGSDGGGPYFWCILFGSGNSTNSFVLDGGVAKSQRPGCFSGTDDECSGVGVLAIYLWPYTFAISILMAYVFLL
ncbi:hypothetical protein AQUCO_07600082v1 [Aquilegia coerulea]|uniref:Ferredoxin-like protein n=1 Tax=Aquilegia coerulea TaxID=218851 RepID=A0A2G5C8T4_AQUCA|nr:hypothetical protein AQUCO_07600082v1 [Aquilegia coerulea]